MKNKFILCAVLLMAAFAATSFATTWNYPGSSPCDATLQKCINGATSGDTIFISAATVDEDLLINKSLNLLPKAPDSTVVIGGGITTRTISVKEGNSGKTVEVLLNQLSLQNAVVVANFASGFGHHFSLTDSSVNVNKSGVNAITITTTVPAMVDITRNSIASSGFAVAADYNDTNDTESEHYLSVENNTITSADTSLSQGAVQYKVRGTAYNSAMIRNNVIHDVAGCFACGLNSALDFEVFDAAYYSFLILNNTIDHVTFGDGIWLEPPSPNAKGGAYVYNNIVTSVPNAWLHLPSFNANDTVVHDGNTFFAAGSVYGGYPAGPATYNQDPGFVDPANHNYSLNPFSSSLDTGIGPNGGDIWLGTRDWAESPRVLGPAIDRGAIERPGSFFLQYVYSVDNFNDGSMNQVYSYPKGIWAEDGKNLVGLSGKKASMFLDPYMSCPNGCSLSTVIRFTPPSGTTSNKITIYGWYQDSANNVKLEIDQVKGKMTLTQTANGVKIAKKSASITFIPLKDYDLVLRYEGDYNATYISARLWNSSMLTMSTNVSPAGKFNLQTSGSTAYFENASIIP